MLYSAELSPRCPAAKIAEHARALEQRGFHRIWIRDMYVASWEAWTAATAVALSTEKVRIGVDVTNPYTRSPVVTAHAAATLDRLSGGRLDLGLGKGIGEFLGKMGIAMKDGALEEAIPLLRDLLRGKKVMHRGKAFRIRGVQLVTSSLQERLPIYLAATDEEGFRLAGRLADGLLTISAHRPFLERGLALVGKPLPVATWLPYSPSRDELAAYLDDLLPRLPGELQEALGLDKEEVSETELLDSFAVCGPRDLEEKAKRLEGLGISEIIIEYFGLEDLEELQLG